MLETLRGKFALSNIAMMTVDKHFFLRSLHETVFSEVSASCLERVRLESVDNKHRHKTKVRKFLLKTY